MSHIVVKLQSLFDQANALLASRQPLLAMQIAQEAWSLSNDNPDCSNLIGVCAIALGNGAIAEQCWLHAISLCPTTVEAHYNLGVYYTDSQRPEQAKQYFRQALALDASHATAYARLGILLANDKQTEEAEQCYRKALQLNGNDAATYSNLGLLLADCKRFDEAEYAYRQSIALHPDNAQAYTNLGLLLESCNRKTESEEYQRIAVRLNPEAAEIHGNLGNLLAGLERDDEAEACYRQALSLQSGSVTILSNLGVLLASTHRDTEAEQCFRQAITLTNHQPARLNLAMLLLAQGRLQEGWYLHEARYHPDIPHPDAPLPSLSFPQWQGESLNGKSLLICPEQGAGDLIQFCRYVPLLKAQGATQITLVCRPAMVSLMRMLTGVDTVLAIGEPATKGLVHDYWTFPMSLPLHFNTDLASIPVQIPYLQAPPEHRTSWISTLPQKNGRFRVGLVWKGNPHHANDAKRSLPGLLTYAPLWQIEKNDYFGIQYGIGDNDVPDVSHVNNLRQTGAEITDFADTAAILEQMDLLISVDTAVAHLAGALGIRCWVLLPARRTDWRWMHTRSDSPWYPERMRLFRQEKSQSWDQLIEQVLQELTRIF